VRIIARLKTGGPAIHTVLLTEQLGQRGFPGLLVTGVVDPGEGDLTPWAREQGVEPVVLEQFARSPGPLAAVRTLAALCRILFRIRPGVEVLT